MFKNSTDYGGRVQSPLFTISKFFGEFILHNRKKLNGIVALLKKLRINTQNKWPKQFKLHQIKNSIWTCPPISEKIWPSSNSIWKKLWFYYEFAGVSSLTNNCCSGKNRQKFYPTKPNIKCVYHLPEVL